MKFILNPVNGAPIRDVVDFHGRPWFVSKNNEVFEPGQILQFEDDIASFLKQTFGFLEEIEETNLPKVVEAIADKQFVCEEEGCVFATNTKVAFIGHQRSHKQTKEMSVRGTDIPVATPSTKDEYEKKTEVDRQKQIDSEGAKDGLYGEGLVEERI